jgi:hypothetical protein
MATDAEVRAAAVAVLLARENATEAREEIRQLEGEHRGAYEARTAAIKAETEAMTHARDVRLAHFYESGQKGEVYGLSIQMRPAFIYDKQTALDWLILHRPDLLTFDPKVFEQVAQAGLQTGDRSLNFVQRGERPTATVAGDDRLAAAIRGDDIAAQIAAGEIKP